MLVGDFFCFLSFFVAYLGADGTAREIVWDQVFIEDSSKKFRLATFVSVVFILTSRLFSLFFYLANPSLAARPVIETTVRF